MTELPRPSVLVVDDDHSNLAVVASVLQGSYRLRLVGDGERALRLARAERPDLVLLDIEMPGLDGYEVCERLKAEPSLADVPVIFLTGRSSVADEAAGFARGAVDYIHKPISPPVLVARIHTHLALQAALEDVRRERAKAAALLEVVLPRAVAEELRRTGTVEPRRVEPVGVLFCDLVGFTAFCDDHEPEVVVAGLDAVFRAFERIAHAHGVEKLKTIGDGFLAAVGIFGCEASPLDVAVRCGLEMARAVPTIRPEWQARVGVDVGTVVSGIVGGERFQFDVWGTPVNVASALVGVGAPGTVCVTAERARGLSMEFPRRTIGAQGLKDLGEHEVIEIG